MENAFNRFKSQQTIPFFSVLLQDNNLFTGATEILGRFAFYHEWSIPAKLKAASDV